MGTVFRFQLALRTIVLADETLQREALTQGLLCAQIGLLLVEDGQLHQSPFPSSEAGFGTLRNLALARVAELHALGTARARVEARFFDGMAVLFPAMAREWAEQVERSELVALSAVRLAELDGIAPPPPDDPEALEARVSQLVADLVEPARSKAFDEIGDGRRAASIAIRWLQPKLGAAAS